MGGSSPNLGPESKLGKAGWRVKECHVLVATFRCLFGHGVAARLHISHLSVQRLYDCCWATKMDEPLVQGQSPDSSKTLPSIS